MFKAKRGYWIREERLFRADRFICSECRAVSKKTGAKCPKCGAKMGRAKADPKWVDELEFWDAITDD